MREDVIDQLIMNYRHGELSLEAFERRLDDAMGATDHNILITLTADLDLSVDQNFINNKKSQLQSNYIPGETKEVEYVYQIFSNNVRTGSWALPKEIPLLSIFSCADINLSEAQFSSPVVRISLFSLFSGGNIFVADRLKGYFPDVTIFSDGQLR